ncbi:MAG: ROK family transcriptional regulator [Thermaceae bacterium]|nr:ROK family transcriptional regulator [Thermaceae bacterium]
MLPSPEGSNRLRLHNRLRVLELLVERGRASRAEIAERISISKVTVTLIVNELIEEGVLLEAGKTEGIVGRPAGLVELHPATGGVAGLDIQPQTVGVLQGNLRGEILYEEVLPVDNTLTDVVVQQLEVLLDSDYPLKQVVIALPAPIGNDGLPKAPNSLPQLEVQQLMAWSVQHDTPIALENDVKLAAIAEHRSGTARQTDNFALLAERPSGIGLGLFLGGQLYRGERGFSGEIALLRWPQGNMLTPLEELPLPQREMALAQLISGLAVALDLSLLVVQQNSTGALTLDLTTALLELVPPNVRVVQSALGEHAPRLGAFLEATRLAQTQLLQSVAVSAPLALPNRR